MNSSLFEAFKKGVLPWYQQNQRELPWRNTYDPYAIWLSEIILQQTRVQQGLSYYYSFLSAFPTVQDLASAQEDQIFRLWQGLGYYSRARNLHRTAKLIVSEWEGCFPNTWEGLQQLPGVGPYTAAAIGSFAFDVPKAAIDGNVLRWASRLFGSDAPIDVPATRNWIQDELDGWISMVSPHLFNQAAMEFGALLCTSAPRCMDCPMQQHCIAYRENRVHEIPVKSKKVKVEERFLYAFFIENVKGQFAVEKRPSKGIWGNLYTFPMVMQVKEWNDTEVLAFMMDQKWITRQLDALPEPYIVSHLLTHRKLKVHIFSILLKNMPKNASIFERWITVKEAGELGFPKVFEQFLKTQFTHYAGRI
jgi:A/G-specific adenine glycosylase